MKKTAFFLLLLSGIISGVYSQNSCAGLLPDTAYSTISAAQFNDTVNAYADKHWLVILDVRTPFEYNGSHIEEAVNIDYYSSSFATELASLDRGKVYMIYCASGSRSGQVFLQMQNLDFRCVYNMNGGMGAWNPGGFPTTALVAPIAGVCDTNAIFSGTVAGTVDSIPLTLTNAANGLLTVLNVSDLTGTVFSTDFDPSATLKGGRDKTFYIRYHPDDEEADSAVFIISTNGGDITLWLHGTPYQTTTASWLATANTVIHDPLRCCFRVDGSEPVQAMELYDVHGRILATSKYQNELYYSPGQKGIVILKQYDGNTVRSLKFALVP